MSAVALDTTLGAEQPAEPAAPQMLRIDVAECVRAIGATVPAPPMPYPERDAMELQLLEAAKDCAANGAQLPRRELVAVALREAARQEWWRDQAEAEAAALKREIVAMTQAHAKHVEELRHHRKQVLSVLFEIIAWAAHQLGCEPSGKAVLAAIRSRGTGWLQHETRGDEVDRLRAEVANG